ncbi:MAG: hypothetical protein JW889_03425 [Verrucomicrobia bacterium]|nr:hypothetical protein [Verrucomicrobiota bacterium]
MRFPKYWARADGEAKARDGETVTITVWRWSDTSQAEADALAREAAQAVAERAVRDGTWPQHYHYADRPLREEVLEELADEQGEQMAVISRTAYGSLVLNAARVMFVDVDLPPPPRAGCLGVLFAKRKAEGQAAAWRDEHEKAELAVLGDWMMRNRDWGVRIYRTFAGLRYLVTHAPMEPDSNESRFALTELNADPLFIKLCHVQQCFRARLTPKPWRLNGKLDRPTVRWPYMTQEAEATFRQWEAEYDAACAEHATCAFVGTLGTEAVHPHIAPIVQLHDEMTRVGTQLELA